MALNLPKVKISPREKRLIGVAVAAIVLFFSFDHLADFFYYRPQRTRQQIFHERGILERSQLKLKARPSLEAKIAAAKEKAASTRGRLLPGEKPPVAAASLQQIIDQVARETNVEIKSQKIDKPKEHAQVLEVPVEVVFLCNVGELKNFIYRIEGHPKLLIIPRWSIRVPNHRDPKQVQVNLTISGFIMKT